MPSGFTHKIYDGKDVTASEFIADCAKAFGAYVMVRDLPDDQKPDVFEPDTHYIERAKWWESELHKLMNMTEEEAQVEADNEYESNVKSRQESIENKTAIRQRYESVLESVKKWTPPTDEHVNLKEFCIKQLEDSMQWDCNTSYYDGLMFHRKTGREWLEYNIQNAKQTIENCYRDHEAEVQRTNERNQWIKQLKDSLTGL